MSTTYKATEIHNMLVPAHSKNSAEMWKRWEEHSDHDTVAFDLENGLFLMRCAEHNVPHIIAVKQS